MARRHEIATLLAIVAASLGHGSAPSLAQDPGAVLRDCAQCPELVVIPEGTFAMGSAQANPGLGPGEGPQHRVTIAAPLAVSRFEITVAEYGACLSDGGCTRGADDHLGPRHPISGVTFDDARRYAAWLARKTGKPYRLLSEAEYEYATRAGTQSAYPWGDSIGGRATGKGQPSPVGSFPANRFGLHDMVGSNQSWVEDCLHEDYRGAPADGSVWAGGDCSYRMARGGDWGTGGAVRSAERRYHSPDNRDVTISLRVVRALGGGRP